MLTSSVAKVKRGLILDHSKKMKGAMANLTTKIATSAMMNKYGMGLFK